jgi:hypothetical protein
MTEQELILSAILKITPILSIYFWGTIHVFIFASAVTLMIIPCPNGRESFKKLIFYSFCAFSSLLGIISNVKDFLFL